MTLADNLYYLCDKADVILTEQIVNDSSIDENSLLIESTLMIKAIYFFMKIYA